MATPDMVKAHLDYLRLCPALTSLGADVLTVRPASATGNAVVVEIVGGDSDARGQWRPRVQLVCFGAGAATDFATQQRLASDVWAAADDWLLKHDGSRQGFVGSDCVVPVIFMEAGPLRTVDALSRRPVTIGIYRPRVKAVAA